MPHIELLELGSPEYERALKVYRAHSTERTNLTTRLTKLVEPYPESATLADFGAGAGDFLTLGRFGKRIAVEPSPTIATTLRTNFPGVEVIEAKTRDVVIPGGFDVGLLIHVLYYEADAEWGPRIIQLARQMKPGGAFVVVLMSPIGGTNILLRHFGARRLNLLKQVEPVLSGHPEYTVTFSSVPNSLRFESYDEAELVARWMAADRPPSAFPEPMTEEAFRRYIHDHFFLDPAGTWGWESPATMLVIRQDEYFCA